jgi:ribonucleoside-diphosphate reductase alpha chain
MTDRERLPNRRSSELFEFESMNIHFTGSVSHYDDGRIGEIFIDNHKAGSAIGTLVRDLAIAFSFAVQHGADAEAIRCALCRDSSGKPLGPLGAVLDLLVDQEISEARERLES